MKKIKNSSVNQKDRIVCVALPGELEFYYQTFGNGKRIALFRGENDKPKPFSGTVFNFFRENGRCFDGHSGFSLTIKELYAVDKCRYSNPKLAKLIERLPGAINMALREQSRQTDQVKRNNRDKNADKLIYEERELAA